MAKYIYRKDKDMPINKSVVKYGDVVDVSFYLNPVIEKVYKCGSESQTCNSVTRTKLAHDFVLYDDIEDIDTKQAILIIANMIETCNENEEYMLHLVHEYYKKRIGRLKEIKKQEKKELDNDGRGTEEAD